MKKISHLFTALLLFCSTMSFAETAVIDGITYNIDKEARTASVIASDTKYTGNIVIPETIKHNEVTYNVTRIEGTAFYYCNGLRSITIPNSIESIGRNAFQYCGLKEVHISSLSSWCNIDFDGRYANPLSYSYVQNLFLNGELLSNIVIPNNITEIIEMSTAILFI